MRILLDEDVPHKLRIALLPRDATTVAYAGWKGLRNGELLVAAEAAGYEVFITCDKNLSYQQNLRARHLSIIVLGGQDWPVIRAYIDDIVQAIDQASPGSFLLVVCS